MRPATDRSQAVGLSRSHGSRHYLQVSQRQRPIVRRKRRAVCIIGPDDDDDTDEPDEGTKITAVATTLAATSPETIKDNAAAKAAQYAQHLSSTTPSAKGIATPTCDDPKTPVEKDILWTSMSEPAAKFKSSWTTSNRVLSNDHFGICLVDPELENELRNNPMCKEIPHPPPSLRIGTGLLSSNGSDEYDQWDWPPF
ncbi:hypothetical protein VTJ04DRAFT_1254 [Mycothermus thermophilus]|uniref:uncharacterized protein n=1 Tax=Humicola insolens TaxID=85995 RepID=UPI0037444CB5